MIVDEMPRGENSHLLDLRSKLRRRITLDKCLEVQLLRRTYASYSRIVTFAQTGRAADLAALPENPFKTLAFSPNHLPT